MFNVIMLSLDLLIGNEVMVFRTPSKIKKVEVQGYHVE